MKILLLLPFNVYNGKYDNELVIAGGGESEIPLGIGYIKSYLKNKIPEVEVKIYDSNIDAMDYIVNKDPDVSMDFLWDRLRNKIDEFSPDIVGVSAFSHAIALEAHKVVAVCKVIDKKTVTVMGASYPTLSYDTAIKDKNLDIIVMSEGEIVFYNLVKAMKYNEPLSEVGGIVYKENEKVIVNPIVDKIPDLDVLPYPDLDDLRIDLYGKIPRHSMQRLMKNLRPISMVSARGCVFQCGFCATKEVWGNARHRSPESIIEEIKYLKIKYDFNFFKFNDDLFSLLPERVIKICDLLIKEKLVDQWSTTGLTVKSLLNREMVDKMIQSGYYMFALAIESGCENTLKQINKPLKLSMVKEVVDNLRRYDKAYVTGAFVVGFPFETKEDIQKTFDLAESLDFDWSCFNMFTPFPKTSLYDYCIEHGYIKDKEISYNDLQNTSVVSTPNFDKEWLKEIVYFNNLKINFVNNHFLKRGNYQRAIEEFHFVRRLAPDHAIAILLIAFSYERMKKHKEAEVYYKKAEDIFNKKSFWMNYFNKLENEIKSRTNIRDFWVDGKLTFRK
ncbi:radical SAM protein [Candidatus Woesearchaeota archaeon]|jgi:anaerobic magnesium-protoporphyrin IX monomethyl ester cyclase|nr:radical SAM protein [Candidatus Woesearchaeota archaeon]